VLIENEGDDNSEASLKEGVDMRISEQKAHTRPLSDNVYTGEMTVGNVKEFEWQLH